MSHKALSVQTIVSSVRFVLIQYVCCCCWWCDEVMAAELSD